VSSWSRGKKRIQGRRRRSGEAGTSKGAGPCGPSAGSGATWDHARELASPSEPRDFGRQGQGQGRRRFGGRRVAPPSRLQGFGGPRPRRAWEVENSTRSSHTTAKLSRPIFPGPSLGRWPSGFGESRRRWQSGTARENGAPQESFSQRAAPFPHVQAHKKLNFESQQQSGRRAGLRDCQSLLKRPAWRERRGASPPVPGGVGSDGGAAR
jgi:hypothetical protein